MAILSVLPLGTGNDFARSLGVPSRLVEACAVVAQGKLAQVDLGRAGERYFINAASIGGTSEMTVSLRQRPRRKKGLGRLAYPTVALGKALAKRAFTVALDTDGARLTLRALEVVVGNGRYHCAGLIIAPEASLQDHVLDLYAILSGHEPGQAWRDLLVLARVARKLRAGRHVADPLVLHMRTPRVRLDADPDQVLDLDGELRGRTPVLLECVPMRCGSYCPRSAYEEGEPSRRAAWQRSGGEEMEAAVGVARGGGRATVWAAGWQGVERRDSTDSVDLHGSE
ncbi:MAG: diacylglycerol kinase family protein [Myxococcales bacterium]